MSGGIEIRRNKYAIAKAAAWGTSVTLGALTLINPTGTGGNAGQEREIVMNPGAGFPLPMCVAQGPEKPAELKFTIWAHEDSLNALMLLCMIYGNNTPTGAGDPYTHTGIWQDVAEYMFTWGNENGDQEFRIPTAMLDNLTFKFDTGANVVVFESSAKGNKLEISADTTSIFATSTLKTCTAPFSMHGTTLWINTQSGGALSGSDAASVIDLQLEMPRPSDAVHVTGSSYIIQPKQGAVPERKLTFKIPHKDAMAKTLYTAYLAKTAQKALITCSGTSANRELKLFEPIGWITKCSNPDNDVIATEVELLLGKATAAPTGMAQASPYFIWKTNVAISPIA